MADESRDFVISPRRNWLLYVLGGLALVYFLAVILLEVLDYEIAGVSTEMLVLVGVALFVLIILVEVPFLLRRRAKPEQVEDEPREPVLHAAPRAAWDDELMTTSESQQGMAVLEYSAPAKSRNRNAVYTKTYVPVTKEHVMRVETLVADAGDL